eukprot:COSAG01_NODE_6180_length_3806_cov_35.350958_3_plen_41_part_00
MAVLAPRERSLGITVAMVHSLPTTRCSLVTGLVVDTGRCE